MARCTGCGAELPAIARFCSLCGKESTVGSTKVPATRPVAKTGYTTPPAGGSSGKRNIAIAAGIGAVMILVSAFLFAKASGILNATRPEVKATGILNAPPTVTTSAPILNVPPTEVPKAPVLQAPETAGNPMPEDIIAYLRWLKKFETARRELESKSASQAMSDLQSLMLDMTTGRGLGLLDADSSGETKPEKPTVNYAADMNKIIQEWNQANGYFQQRTPPNPCAPLATAYNGALSTSVAQMTHVQTMMMNALGSIKDANGEKTATSAATQAELMGEKNSRGMSQGIDAGYSTANSALDTLRDRYTQIPSDIDKSHFDIKTDGGKLKMPAMLGM